MMIIPHNNSIIIILRHICHQFEIYEIPVVRSINFRPWQPRGNQYSPMIGLGINEKHKLIAQLGATSPKGIKRSKDKQ